MSFQPYPPGYAQQNGMSTVQPGAANSMPQPGPMKTPAAAQPGAQGSHPPFNGGAQFQQPPNHQFPQGFQNGQNQQYNGIPPQTAKPLSQQAPPPFANHAPPMSQLIGQLQHSQPPSQQMFSNGGAHTQTVSPAATQNAQLPNQGAPTYSSHNQQAPNLEPTLASGNPSATLSPAPGVPASQWKPPVSHPPVPGPPGGQAASSSTSTHGPPAQHLSGAQPGGYPPISGAPSQFPPGGRYPSQGTPSFHQSQGGPVAQQSRPSMGGPPSMMSNVPGTMNPPSMTGPGMTGPQPGPPMGGHPGMAGPPMGGPPGMAGPPMGGPPGMAGPPMGGPPGMTGPPMGGPPGMTGPPMMGGPTGMASPPMGLGSHPGGPPMAGPPGMGGPPGMPGGFPGAEPPRRMDLQSLPSVVKEQDIDADARGGVFPTGYPTAENPPMVSTDFYSHDQGNCNPRFMRSTIYVAPASGDMLKSSNMPFAVACTPFAKLHPKEAQPPIVDLGPSGPVRCQRCKAYMCPFMEFQDGGRRFRCPCCASSTAVEDVYFAHLDHTGRRTDIEHRPELYMGAYDYVATKQYCKNGLAPKEPAFIFMIDVSYNSISSGMLSTLCFNLDKVLRNLPKDIGQSESSIHVGLATFDQVVHFYDLSSEQPRMLVVGDVNDMFVPIVDGLLMPYSQAAGNIRAVLEALPRLFEGNKATETILGPVVNAGLDALKCADRAGKLFIFSTALPTYEAPGKLKCRNERNLLGTEKEKTAVTPQCDYYTKLGEQCVKSGVTVDLFLFPNSFIDVATIAQLSAVTGGSVYKYVYFTQENAIRFLQDLNDDVSKHIGFDCMVRVRSSVGIRPVQFMGSFYMENSTDLEMASIDQDKTFFAELKHDDKLSDQNAVIQCAILYTSVSGQRRLRILNMCIPVSQQYQDLYKRADADTTVTYLYRLAVHLNREKGLKETKDTLSQRASQILACYREKTESGASPGHLILPESLKLLPLYISAIVKNDAVCGGPDITVDDKVWMMELVRGMTVTDSLRLLYPRITPVSNVELQNPDELTTLPTPIRCSYEFLQKDQAYLIDNGVVLFLWIGLGIAEAWIQDVFGVNAVSMMDPESHKIPEKDNSKSRGLRRIIKLIEDGPGVRRRKLFIIPQSHQLEGWLRKFLIEDKVGQMSNSYSDILCEIHQQIRAIMGR